MILQAVISGVLMGLIFSLIALGLTIIFGVMNIVNFAHGEFLMIGMYGAYFSSLFLSIDPLLTIPISMAIGALLGLISYYLLIKSLLRGPMIAQIFGTFGLCLFLRYLAMFIWGPNYKMLHHGLLIGKSFLIGSVIIDYAKLGAAGISCLAFVIIYWMLGYTRTGRALRATSINAEAAGYMGINADKMNALAWVIGGATVGIAGALLVNFYYIYPTIGFLFCMIAFATVALGGFGNIGGAFLAGIIIGLVENVGGQYIGVQFKFALIYLVYFLVVIFRPQGLLGR